MNIKKEQMFDKDKVLLYSNFNRENSDDEMIIGFDSKTGIKNIKDIEFEKNSEFSKILHQIIGKRRTMIDKAALQLVVKRKAIDEIRGVLILESEYLLIKDQVDPEKKLNIIVVKNSPQEKILASDMAKRLSLGPWQTLSLIVAKRENCTLYLSTRMKEDYYLSQIRAVSIDLLV